MLVGFLFLVAHILPYSKRVDNYLAMFSLVGEQDACFSDSCTAISVCEFLDHACRASQRPCLRHETAATAMPCAHMSATSLGNWLPGPC